VVHRLPIVPVEVSEFTQLRQKRPILLLAILAFATSNVVDDETRNDLVDKAMQTLGVDLIGSGDVSIPHVQAALLASFWYRSTPKSARHSTVEQIVQLVTSVSIAMGLAGPGSAKFSTTAIPDTDMLLRDGPRAWLGCFIATTAMSLTTRRQDANVWTPYHDECWNYLKISPSATDVLFCLLVTITRLNLQTAQSLGLYDSAPMIDVSDPVHRVTISDLRTQIDTWSTEALATRSPELMFWHQAALVHLYEPVLYTPTNKTAFSAPYLTHKLTPEDFAAPAIVTDAHIVALRGLKDACHRALDIATNMGPGVILSLDSMAFIPRILFVLLVLLKLYIAVTAPGNTYGNVMHKDELQVEFYLARMGILAKELQEMDGLSWNAMIISATMVLEQWLVTYNAELELSTTSGEGTSTEDELTFLTPDGINTALGSEQLQWNQTEDPAWHVPLPLDDNLPNSDRW
jgi:hypothetical protein